MDKVKVAYTIQIIVIAVSIVGAVYALSIGAEDETLETIAFLCNLDKGRCQSTRIDSTPFRLGLYGNLRGHYL